MAANTRFAVAVHSAGLIAFGDRMTVNSESIARSVGTNPVVVRRVVGLLAKAGLVVMRKGQSGGALLARPAEKISLGDIYRAVESGPVLAVPDFGAKLKEQCPIARLAAPVLRVFFGDAERSMMNKLDKTRLSDVIHQVCAQQKAKCL
jgi:Rrf2 family protein